MKINVEKVQGAKLVAFDDFAIEELNKFKTGGVYEVEIKRHRNPDFHRKVFQFFQFCFHYWKGDYEFQSEAKQFDVFRKELTISAGFYEAFYNIKGEVRVEAKSLSYGSMEQSEFEECYSALIGAAMRDIFAGSDDPNIYNQLLSYF